MNKYRYELFTDYSNNKVSRVITTDGITSIAICENEIIAKKIVKMLNIDIGTIRAEAKSIENEIKAYPDDRLFCEIARRAKAGNDFIIRQIKAEALREAADRAGEYLSKMFIFPSIDESELRAAITRE